MFHKFLYFLFGNLTGTIIFALYVEFSNKIGNIWLRTDINGFKSLNLSSQEDECHFSIFGFSLLFTNFV